MRTILLIFLGTVVASAQTAHSVTLTWADTLNPSGTTYNVYRAPTACAGTPSFTRIASGLNLKTYTDLTVVPGSYCFQVSAVSSSIESGPSNAATAAVPASPPTNLTVVVQ